MSGAGRILLAVCLSALLTACGRKGALTYPDMLVPAAPSAVTIRQSGSSLKLQFTLSDKDRSGRRIHDVTGVKVSRLIVDAARKDVCRSCMDDYAKFRLLYLDNLPQMTQRAGNSLILLDSDVSVGNSYSYSIVPFTSDGAEGASLVTPFVPLVLPQPAPELSIEPLPTEIRLRFSLSSKVSGRFCGYNVYRFTGSEQRPYLPVNRELLKEGEFIDSPLERGVIYRYFVRALIESSAGEIIESAESNEVEGTLKDDE